jgi:hypothetical protein
MQTISDFFNLHDESAVWVSNVGKSLEFARIKQRMAQEMKGFRVPPSFYELVIRQLADLLNIGMADIFVGAWRKHREIIKYRDSKKYPPGNVYTVPLVEHTITSRHSPTIQPIINNVPLPKLKFDIVLKLKMNGIILKIWDRKVMEILVGSCSGDGSIEYAGFAVLEKKTAPFTLPASIFLKEGIQI